MTDIKVSTITVPRTARNDRIYSRIVKKTYTPAADQPIYRPRAGILSYDAGDFAAREVTVEFAQPFSEIPVGWVRAYRYDTRRDGGVYEAGVVIYLADGDWKDESGFTITIEPYETLSGVFIEYTFNERSSDE